MTYVPQFIAELVRAANTVERLSVRQRRRLFGRAYMEIIELRTAAGVFPFPASLDPAIRFLRATGRTEDLRDDQVMGLLLEAADMLRSLKIALDAPPAAT
jgi:hypothetical protein